MIEKQLDESDEGAAVLAAAQDTSPITDQEKADVLRKTDWRILPMIWVVFGMQYADKSVTGVGALFGLIQDLHLYEIKSVHPTVIDTTRYSNAVMIFFVGYTFGAYPLSLIAQRFPVAKICSLYVLLWGITAILTPLCTTYAGIMVQRFILGFLEGGISAPFLSIIGAWYTKREQSFRAPFMNSAPGFFALIFLGIVYGVVLIGNPLHAWRVIYYFVGGITIALAPIVYWVLPDSQRTASFLTPREKFVANISSHRFKWGQVQEAVTDVKVWLLLAATFCFVSPGGATGSFTGLVINKAYGATGRQSLLLLMPLATISGLTPLLVGLGSLHMRRGRIMILLINSAVAAAGLLMCWIAPLNSKQTLLGGLYLLSVYSGPYSLILGLAVSNVSGATKRTTVSVMVFISVSLSGITAPYFFVTGAPRYNTGFMITMILILIGMVFMAIYGLLAHVENKRRDIAGGSVDHAFEDMTDKENQGFRYVI
ncbi:hypothetical protein RQP46_002403 [Phenoliferia psychrophenolica]